ncbi:MAG: periplasmic protein TonB [Acidobacteriota bacterium]|jgi:TonB family protein|nr:periplasmic protein TonB [Acidobacteriota bacterium]
MRCSNCGNDLPSGVRFCPKCGSAIAPATAPVLSAQPTTSFGAQSSPQPLSGGGMMQQRKKSGCGKALLIVLIICLLLLGVLGGLGYYGYRALGDKLKSSEAYTVALNALKENSTVAEKMGAIKETGFPLGTFNEQAGGTGEAIYHMSVTGTKTTGTYDVVMIRRGGKWYLTNGKLTLASGEVIRMKSPELDRPYGDPVNSNGNDNTNMPPPPPVPGRASGAAVSGGILDSKATSKPDPAYPAVAKAVKASGAVVVQVTVDEQGKVISAHAVSGHPLLRASAEAAARQARFQPMLLSGRPVKVTGMLTYNFEAQP